MRTLWLADLPAFEEFDFVGKTLQIGSAQLRVVERIERCRATETNPQTGERDQNTLAALRDGWGHTDLGIKATVTHAGEIALGDKVRII